jgi:periplasmic protein CpxP/Spy
MKRLLTSSAMSRVATVLAAITLPALALPTGAFAQTSSSTMAPSNMAPNSMAPMAPSPKTTAPATNAAFALPKTEAAKVEAHIAQLRGQLEITPAEGSQWSQFAEVMRENAATMNQGFTDRATNIDSMNAVQDVQSYAQLAQTQADNMQKLATAFQTLYASFPPAQQKVADAVFRAKAASDKKPNLKPTTP